VNDRIHPVDQPFEGVAGRKVPGNPVDAVSRAMVATGQGKSDAAPTPEPFTTGGNGILCRPEQFQPCVAVLVE